MQEAGGERLVRAHQARGKHDFLQPRRADEVHESGVVVHGEAVAERAGDRQSERESGVPTRMSAPAAMPKPPPTQTPSICAITGFFTFDAPRALVAVALVLQAVLRALELGELADIGARDEGLAARALQHQHADRVVRVDFLAHLVEPLVHAPGHGVARLGAVKGQRDDGARARRGPRLSKFQRFWCPRTIL